MRSETPPGTASPSARLGAAPDNGGFRSAASEGRDFSPENPPKIRKSVHRQLRRPKQARSLGQLCVESGGPSHWLGPALAWSGSKRSWNGSVLRAVSTALRTGSASVRLPWLCGFDLNRLHCQSALASIEATLNVLEFSTNTTWQLPSCRSRANRQRAQCHSWMAIPFFRILAVSSFLN